MFFCNLWNGKYKSATAKYYSRDVCEIFLVLINANNTQLSNNTCNSVWILFKFLLIKIIKIKIWIIKIIWVLGEKSKNTFKNLFSN